MAVITHEDALGSFYHQLEFALANYRPHGLRASDFSNVIIAGLGGSGIGGRIARGYFNDKSVLPIEVYSDYKLPAYAGPGSLVILSSYSGLTEETLAMFEEARAKNCKLLCISSGGTLLEWSAAGNIPSYTVESGYQPRMALGFSLTYNLLILGELLGHDLTAELKSLSSLYAAAPEHRQKAADMLNHFAQRMDNKFVVMADNAMEGVGIRFCQQIQENAKTEAFINVLPEANHNAFETYYGILPSNFIFINSNTNHRNNGRFAYLKNLLESQGNLVYTLDMHGAGIAELYRCIYITDWFSIFLSGKKGADNMSVPNISGLKNFLLSYQ